jgi:hypothetical protein
MRFKKHGFVQINIVLLIIIAACTSAPKVVVDALPQYEELFSNEEGWTGADGVYSVALTANTTAWLFGDTWIGQVINGQHVNATLVHNSMNGRDGFLLWSARRQQCHCFYPTRGWSGVVLDV